MTEYTHMMVSMVMMDLAASTSPTSPASEMVMSYGTILRRAEKDGRWAARSVASFSLRRDEPMVIRWIWKEWSEETRDDYGKLFEH